MKGIATLCGSTKFKKEFDRMNTLLTLDGWIVLSVGAFGHVEKNQNILNEIENKKVMLDALHMEKIRMSQIVIIIDKDGYIGESTQREVQYATELKKPIFYWRNRHNWALG